MAEYIERESTLYRMKVDIAPPFKVVAEMPAADVAPVRHGRWLDGKCTVCGWEEPDVCTYDGYETESWIDTPYCPNCGAKMDGGDNH